MDIELKTTKTKRDPKSRLVIDEKGLMYILAHFRNMPRKWKLVKWTEKGCILHYSKRNGVTEVGIEYNNEGVSDKFYTQLELQSMYDDSETTKK